MDRLVDTLRRVRIRLFLQEWMGFILWGLFFSCIACGVWVVLARCFAELGNPLQVCVVVFAAGFLVVTGIAIRRRPSLTEAALEADRRADLKERLTSSLELAGVEGPMIQALHADARTHLTRLDPAKHFSFVVPPHASWAFIPVVLFAAVYVLMPELDLTAFRQRQTEAAARAEATRVRVQRLESLARAMAPREGENAEAVVKVIKAIQRVAEDLRAGKISNKQGFARLTNAAEELEKMRADLAEQNRMPQRFDLSREAGIPEDIANAGRLAAKLQELRDKLIKGGWSGSELEWFEKEVADLAGSLGAKDGALREALSARLAELRGALKMKDLQSALRAMKSMEASVKDLSSVLEQLQKLETASKNLWEMRQAMLGSSDRCRFCGAILKPCVKKHGGTGCGWGHDCLGVCSACAGARRAIGPGMHGPGMHGAGRGAGNRVGPLPDAKTAFNPTTLPGRVTRDKVLLSILQKTAPEPGAKSTAEFLPGAFVKVQQQAEQALTKEEIPPGSREFVRQYFGSLEPQSRKKRPNPN